MQVQNTIEAPKKLELNIETLKAIEAFINRFVKEDKFKAINYCYNWTFNGTKSFGAILPEDLIFNILEKFLEGKAKCYIDSYNHFKGSVYYHLKKALLSYFRKRKRKSEYEENEEDFVSANYMISFDEEIYSDMGEQIFGNLEGEELRNSLFALFDEEKDVEEILVLEELLKGVSKGNKREVIAKSLGLSVNDVTNIEKRIIRKIKNNLAIINRL